MMGFIFLVLALVLNASANILLKVASGNISLKFWDLITNWSLIFGLLFFALNVIFYTIALSKINLSIAYPVMTVGGILIITTASFFYLGESITVKQLFGVLLLIVGLILVVQK